MDTASLSLLLARTDETHSSAQDRPECAVIHSAGCGSPGARHLEAQTHSERVVRQSLALVGSIILRTSVIFVAGKPLISACLLMMASSLAM